MHSVLGTALSRSLNAYVESFVAGREPPFPGSFGARQIDNCPSVHYIVYKLCEEDGRAILKGAEIISVVCRTCLPDMSAGYVCWTRLMHCVDLINSLFPSIGRGGSALDCSVLLGSNTWPKLRIREGMIVLFCPE